MRLKDGKRLPKERKVTNYLLKERELTLENGVAVRIKVCNPELVGKKHYLFMTYNNGFWRNNGSSFSGSVNAIVVYDNGKIEALDLIMALKFPDLSGNGHLSGVRPDSELMVRPVYEMWKKDDKIGFRLRAVKIFIDGCELADSCREEVRKMLPDELIVREVADKAGFLQIPFINKHSEMDTIHVPTHVAGFPQ